MKQFAANSYNVFFYKGCITSKVVSIYLFFIIDKKINKFNFVIIEDNRWCLILKEVVEVQLDDKAGYT